MVGIKKLARRARDIFTLTKKRTKRRYRKAKAYYDTGDYVKAQGLLERVLQSAMLRDIYPDDTGVPLHIQSKMWLGFTYAKQNQHEKAYSALAESYVQCGEAARLIVPSNSHPRHDIGILAFMTSNYADSTAWLLAALQDETDPLDKLKSTLWLGKSYYMSKKLDKAEETFKELANRLRESSSLDQMTLACCHAYQACTYYTQKNFELAATALLEVHEVMVEDIFNHESDQLWTIKKWQAHTAYELQQYSLATKLCHKDIQAAIVKLNTDIDSSNNLNTIKANICESARWFVIVAYKQQCPEQAERNVRAFAEDILSRLSSDTGFQELVERNLSRAMQDVRSNPVLTSEGNILNRLPGKDLQDDASTTITTYLPVQNNTITPSPITRQQLQRPEVIDTSLSPSRATEQISPGTHGTGEESSSINNGTPVTPGSTLRLQTTNVHAESLAGALENLTSTSELESFLNANVTGFDDSEISMVASLLEKEGYEHFSHPRLYLILRNIQSLDVLPNLLSAGLTDYHIPVNVQDLQDYLNETKVKEFIVAQKLVFSQDQDLEQGCTGFHHHFETPVALFKKRAYLFDHIREIYHDRNVEIDGIKSRQTGAFLVLKRYRRLDISTNQRLAEVDPIIAEIQVLRNIDHIHVVKYIGSYTDPTYVGIIQDPLADTDLQDFLKRVHHAQTKDSHEYSRATLKKMKENLRMFVGCLARTIYDLHQEDIRHRDIKPSNILVHGRKVLWSDFGLARRYPKESECITTGIPSGYTREYAAPEVLRNEERGRSSDMWSFGLVLLEIAACLKGCSKTWMRDFLVSHGTEDPIPGFNITGLDKLVEALDNINPDEARLLVNCAREMVKEKPAERLSSKSLYNTILLSCDTGESPGGQYCGDCCRSDEK